MIRTEPNSRFACAGRRGRDFCSFFGLIGAVGLQLPGRRPAVGLPDYILYGVQECALRKLEDLMGRLTADAYERQDSSGRQEQKS